MAQHGLVSEKEECTRGSQDVTSRIYIQPLGLIRFSVLIKNHQYLRPRMPAPSRRAFVPIHAGKWKNHMAPEKLPSQTEGSSLQTTLHGLFLFFPGVPQLVTKRWTSHAVFDFPRRSTWSNRAGGLWLSERNLNRPLSQENLDAHWSGLSHTARGMNKTW